MNRTLRVAVVAAAALWLSANAISASASRTSAQQYLLVLGDSLAAGYQPIFRLKLPPVDAATGFRDNGYLGGYAQDVAHATGLRLVDLGCPGETSRSFSGVPAQPACTNLYRSEFNASSQLAAARAFLSRKRDRVALVTFEIGANDLDACISGGHVSAGCLETNMRAALSAIGGIIAELRSELSTYDPGARLIALNYYDPFLGRAFTPGGTLGATEAAESLAAVRLFDAQLGAVFRTVHIREVDVAAAFGVGKVAPVERFRGKLLPPDVVDACQLTWMCGTSGQRPDIHPNDAGYAAIASAIEKVFS